ncbi:MAG: PEGA domain-containing protein [Patescibacteria group bacterium]
MMAGKMKKLIIPLVLPFLLVFGFLVWQFSKNQAPDPAALSVVLEDDSKLVVLDGKELGDTPFFSRDLEAGNKEVKVASWSAQLRLTPGALTAVNLGMGPSQALSKEEIFWLEQAEESRLAVTTDPEGAQIWIDGKLLGEAPYAGELAPGIYELRVQKKDYEGIALRVQIQEGYRLNAWVKLRRRPVPEEVVSFPPSSWGQESEEIAFTVVDLSLSSSYFWEDPSRWAQAATYWFANHPEAEIVDLYLDREGRFLDSSGKEVERPEKENVRIGYLGKQGEDLPEVVQEVLVSLSGGEVGPQKVRIKSTSVGFLRVRSGPGTAHSEITRINPGNEFRLLDEEAGWYKVQIDEETVGWVTSRYAEKL